MPNDIAIELQKLIVEIIDNLPDGALSVAAQDYYLSKAREIMDLNLIGSAA